MPSKQIKILLANMMFEMYVGFFFFLIFKYMDIDFFLHKNYEKPNTRLTDKNYGVNFPD